jgi:HlyD family secretion protein
MTKTKLFLFALVLIAAASIWAEVSKSPVKATPPAPAPIYVAAAPGLVEPVSEERHVGSEVIGTLRDVLVEENDKVKANQIIAVVKNDDQVALLAQAKAQYDLSQAVMKAAMKDLKRTSALEKKSVSSIAALETAQKNLDVAKAEVEHAAALVQQARANLDKTYIRSPIDGIVLKKSVVAGEAVSNQPPTQIAIIGDLSSLRVRAEVDELDIGKVKKGQRVIIKADAYPNLNAKGTVIRVDKRLGARQIQTDRSKERVDSKVLQVLIALDKNISLPVDLRVDAFFLPDAHSSGH